MRNFKSVSGLIRRNLARKRIGNATSTNSEILEFLESQFNSLRQYVDIQYFLRDGVRIGSMTGFPVAPDIAAWLANEINSVEYSAYIEFGSGVSTAIAATAFKYKSASGSHVNERPCISFEHDSRYFDSTSRLLHQLNLSAYVDLILAPLKESSNDPYPASKFYGGAGAALERLATDAKFVPGPVLVFVDGPPGSASKLSRLSAIFVVHQIFSRHGYKLVLDDSDRAAEVRIAQHWIEFLGAQGANYSVENLATERGAKVFSVR